MAQSKENKPSAPSLRELLEGKPLTADRERELIGSLDPAQRAALLELYSERLRKLRAEYAELQEALENLHAPPLHPATVLRNARDERVEVNIAGRRQLVPVAPEIPLTELYPGR